MKLTIIGFGEAGQAIAEGLRAENVAVDVSCFDIKSSNPDAAANLATAAKRLGVQNAPTLDAALLRAEVVFSTVTAGSALDVAGAVAAIDRAKRPTLRAFFDMNSVAPSTKQAEAALLEAAGIAYVDTAVMAPIQTRLHRTPMLLAGPGASQWSGTLAAWGMDVRVVGAEVGRASSIKMLRSVMIKGLEALTAEMGLAAAKAGVAEEVIASLNASFPGTDWEQKTSYNLERMATHGVRRAEEMEEVVKTLLDLGINPELSQGTVRRQRRFGESGLVLSGAEEPLKARAERVFNQLNEV